jgi:hypothetical protein
MCEMGKKKPRRVHIARRGKILEWKKIIFGREGF